MDDHIRELNDKVNVALATCEKTGLQLMALNHAVCEILAPLLVANGSTREHIEELRTEHSTNALYLRLKNVAPADSDRWTHIMSEELNRIFASLSICVELAQVKRQQAEIAEQRAELHREIADIERRKQDQPPGGFWASLREDAADKGGRPPDSQ